MPRVRSGTQRNSRRRGRKIENRVATLWQKIQACQYVNYECYIAVLARLKKNFSAENFWSIVVLPAEKGRSRNFTWSDPGIICSSQKFVWHRKHKPNTFRLFLGIISSRVSCLRLNCCVTVLTCVFYLHIHLSSSSSFPPPLYLLILLLRGDQDNEYFDNQSLILSIRPYNPSAIFFRFPTLMK